MRSLELRVPPVLQVAIAGTLIVLLAQKLPSANWPFAGHRLVAIGAVLLGVASGLAGVIALRLSRTTVDPRFPAQASAIVVTGIYRFTRNPMYLGMALALLGVVCWRGTLPGLLVIGGFVAFISRFQIVPEERLLTARFGDQYRAYLAAVRRWL